MKGLKDRKISDDMLNGVNGGVKLGSKNEDGGRRVTCNHCHEMFRVTNDEQPVKCPFCHQPVDEKKKSIGSVGNTIIV